MAQEHTALTVAHEQLKIAAEKLHLDKGIYEILRRPKRAILVSVTIKMDDHSIGVFDGCRVQHWDCRLCPSGFNPSGISLWFGTKSGISFSRA